jgi:hypothetical protein
MTAATLLTALLLTAPATTDQHELLDTQLTLFRGQLVDMTEIGEGLCVYESEVAYRTKRIDKASPLWWRHATLSLRDPDQVRLDAQTSWVAPCMALDQQIIQDGGLPFFGVDVTHRWSGEAGVDDAGVLRTALPSLPLVFDEVEEEGVSYSHRWQGVIGREAGDARGWSYPAVESHVDANNTPLLLFSADKTTMELYSMDVTTMELFSMDKTTMELFSMDRRTKELVLGLSCDDGATMALYSMDKSTLELFLADMNTMEVAGDYPAEEGVVDGQTGPKTLAVVDENGDQLAVIDTYGTIDFFTADLSLIVEGGFVQH